MTILQGRDDGLQQIIIILMMVVFAIFNFIADRLKRRSGGPVESDEPPVFVEDQDEAGYWDEERQREREEVVSADRVDHQRDVEPTRAGREEETESERPWWERPEPASVERPLPPIPERLPPPVVVPRTVSPRPVVVQTPRDLTTVLPLPTRRPERDRIRDALPASAAKRSAPRITASDARRGIVMMTVLGRCPGLEPISGRVALLVVALVGLAGCASAPASSPAPPAPAPDRREVVVGDSAAIARARADSARYPYTAADIHFMTAMIHHHAQAIRVARLVPSRTSSDEIRRLAARIIGAQDDEIHLMQQWLADRRQPAPEVDSTGAVAGHHGHDMQMPGMLTTGQLAQLEAARGAEFDRLFLTRMIEHHQGAVTMVRELFGTQGAGQDQTVFRFASDVQVDQLTEIERMRRMLAAITLSP